MKTENTVWCKCIWPLEDDNYSICMVCGNQLRNYKNNEGSPCLPEELKQGKNVNIDKVEPIKGTWFEEAGEISDEVFDELKTVTPRQLRLTYRGKEIPTECWCDHEVEMVDLETNQPFSNKQWNDLLDSKKEVDFKIPVMGGNVMYAIYAQSGFYKSWKFVQVPENVFYPYGETSTAIIDFCAKWPGFTKILKMEKTDVKIHE